MIWEKRKAGIIATLKRGRCSSAAILSANTTLLPSAAICLETITQLRDAGLVAKITVGNRIYEYELVAKFYMPAPKVMPGYVPQVPIYELGL